jgi:hypothetical protein
MKKAHRAVTALLAIAALLVTACGGAGDTPKRPATSTSTSSAPPAVTEPATPPGTRLAVGERAVIPYDDSIRKGTYAVTVTAIKVGDQAAFEQNFGEDAKTTVPYYISYRLENLGGTDLSIKNGPRLSGLLADGSSPGVFLTGDLPDCVFRVSPGDFDHVGAAYENCQLVAASQGDEIVAAGYDDHEYDGKPLVWHK